MCSRAGKISAAGLLNKRILKAAESQRKQIIYRLLRSGKNQSIGNQDIGISGTFVGIQKLKNIIKDESSTVGTMNNEHEQ